MVVKKSKKNVIKIKRKIKTKVLRGGSRKVKTPNPNSKHSNHKEHTTTLPRKPNSGNTLARKIAEAKKLQENNPELVEGLKTLGRQRTLASRFAIANANARRTSVSSTGTGSSSPTSPTSSLGTRSSFSLIGGPRSSLDSSLGSRSSLGSLEGSRSPSPTSSLDSGYLGSKSITGTLNRNINSVSSSQSAVTPSIGSRSSLYNVPGYAPGQYKNLNQNIQYKVGNSPKEEPVYVDLLPKNNKRRLSEINMVSL